MLKQVFLPHFEPVVMRFGLWKIPKCLENAPFWDQKWVPYVSNTRRPCVIARQNRPSEANKRVYAFIFAIFTVLAPVGPFIDVY